jgi:hypothetical protein
LDLFRHARAIHLYRGGMPLALVSEWLGHAQLETTLIYAHADTNMKREAIDKAANKSNPLICSDVKPMWQDDEEIVRIGLSNYPDFHDGHILKVSVFSTLYGDINHKSRDNNFVGIRSVRGA